MSAKKSKLLNKFRKFDRRNDEEDVLLEYASDLPGSIPGTLRIESDAKPSRIVLIDYSADRAERFENLTPEACAQYLDTQSVSWFDVSGFGSEEILNQLAEVFDLHPLLLEDVVNVPQRPKIEDYRDQLVVLLQMALLKPHGQGFWLEQVSFVVGKYYVLTVQEEPDLDCFDPVRDRIYQNKGIIRSRGTDYLVYTLWDAVIDGYFPVLEAYGDRLEILETEVVLSPSDRTLAEIYKIKRELLAIRRVVWPQREAINTLLRDGSPLIGEDVRVYLRDCYDHTVHLIDMVETYRELASSLMDVYLSVLSNKMNEIMKLLAIISTIFIPLTFIAGIYGMNFNTDASPWNMPELNAYWGYPICLGIMFVLATSLVYFFWRRGWFHSGSTIDRN
ncbi:MAG TPA: magnesium/cobalt transporter CorA [Oscillatoriales cyanobacterium M59_W2019_021]|nr:MAG: magnesium and cobalt transport protein CorA [Cyanobacteria bacterium J055]HIK33471.1 magnesium/cobalt transporter CorA [Oscillatoriales cyanobacterium M4454_W2019_049]HIK51582.1 magnesium/cobalt transporter CorA [Oscillatoriales cyanobacterium M59_W2019_021]